MRNKSWQAPLTFLIVSTLVLSLTRTTSADWSDSFTGTFEQFWQFGSDGGDALSFLGGQVINDQLVLTANKTPDDGGAETGFGVVLTESFTDVRMTGVVNPNGDEMINDTVALLIRGNTVNQSFYMAEIHYTDQELIIYRNNPAFEGGNSNLIIEPIPDLNFSESLYVEIEAIGSHLEVWAYDDATKANLRATTSFDDTSEAAVGSGLSGVLVSENFGGIAMLGVWDDLTSSVISTAPPGDYDDSGQVGQGDLDLVLLNWGTSSPPVPAGWINEQPAGLIGQAALDGVLLNWGNTAVGAVAAIPEPNTLVLACGLLLFGCKSRRWR